VPTTTERDSVRREAIGDITAVTVITDADLDYYWDNGGDSAVLLTAALCCEMLAGRMGGTKVLIASLGDGVSVDRHVQPDELRKRAMELRRRYLFGDAPGAFAFSTAVRAVWSDSPDAFTSDTDEFSA
jgi:hypothetical protein